LSVFQEVESLRKAFESLSGEAYELQVLHYFGNTRNISIEIGRLYVNWL